MITHIESFCVRFDPQREFPASAAGSGREDRLHAKQTRERAAENSLHAAAANTETQQRRAARIPAPDRPRNIPVENTHTHTHTYLHVFNYMKCCS